MALAATATATRTREPEAFTDPGEKVRHPALRDAVQLVLQAGSIPLGLLNQQ